jgi:hypothetical protein
MVRGLLPPLVAGRDVTKSTRPKPFNANSCVFPGDHKTMDTHNFGFEVAADQSTNLCRNTWVILSLEQIAINLSSRFDVAPFGALISIYSGLRANARSYAMPSLRDYVTDSIGGPIAGAACRRRAIAQANNNPRNLVTLSAGLVGVR